MSTKSQKQSDFTQGNLARHVVIMSLTSSLGVMTIYVVDLCDIFFVSLLGEKQMAAAAGYASTLMFAISALNIGVSAAAGALVSMAIGANDRGKAREVATCAAMASIIISSFFTSLLLFNLNPALAMIGATGEVAQMAKGYLWIILPSSLLSGLSMVAVASLRSDGRASWAMYPSLCGALVNLVFDPIFIFALDFGLDGAAIATVMARVATFGIAFYAALRLSKLFGTPSLAHFKHHFKGLVHYTLPAAVSSLAAPVGMALVTKYMSGFGAGAVAGMAIVGRLYPVVFSVVNALAGATTAIIGQNFGAGRIDRVKLAYFNALGFLAIYVFIVTCVLFLTRHFIGQAFSMSGKSLELLYLFCGPLSIIAFFNGSIMASNAVLANIGYPTYPMWVQWARNTVGIIPFVEFGSYMWGAEGVFIGATLGGAAFSAFSITFCLRKIYHADAKQIASKITMVESFKTSAGQPQNGWSG